MIREKLVKLRDAAHTGDSVQANWQNLVDCHTAMGCDKEVTFYIKDWWQVNMKDVEIDWVCAQWFDLPAERWERSFAERHCDSPMRYIVATPELKGQIQNSYFIQAHTSHCSSTKIPTTGISWLDACALANKKSIEEGYQPVYFFNEDKEPLIAIDGLSIKSLYEDESADGYRLPTRDEWVTACLAGREGQDTPWGNHSDFEDSFKALDPYVVCYENSKGSMAQVGTKLPNQWGLFDMLGNTFEFTSEEV
jgi:formylglycine-generating enzyme required for sulfatase activity